MFGRLFYDGGSAARHSLGSEINKNDTKKNKNKVVDVYFILSPSQGRI